MIYAKKYKNGNISRKEAGKDRKYKHVNRRKFAIGLVRTHRDGYCSVDAIKYSGISESSAHRKNRPCDA